MRFILDGKQETAGQKEEAGPARQATAYVKVQRTNGNAMLPE